MSKRGSVASFGLLIVGVVVLGAVLFRQQIIDQYRFWRFSPSQQISSLSERAGMSDTGRFYFYVTHPRLKPAGQFNDDCRRTEKNNPILGCYQQGADTIHIYDVTDLELDGIKEVTAAHEMLHAVYSRLSESEKRRLEPLLEQAYVANRDAKFEERMAYYDRAQPGSRHDELHSIVATEFSSLTEGLEQHYARYFTDRQAVVRLHAQYTARFSENQRQIDQLTSKLESLKPRIDQAVSTYQSELSAYNTDVAAFNRRAQAGDFTSQQAFNRERQAIMSRSLKLQNDQATTQAMIDEYNTMVEKLKNLGQTMNRLNQSLDSQRAVQ